MKVSIIIGTLNHLDDLLKPCLESIKANTDLSDTEVIVVANGCTDGTKEYVESLGEPFKLLWFDKPLGFPRTNNEGIAVAKGDYIVLLNNDTVLLNNQWMNILLAPFVDQKVGMTGAVKFTFNCSGVEREVIAFWCTAIKRAVFDEIGYLDEAFNPFGCEDFDFSIRASLAGFKLVQVPNNDRSEFFVYKSPELFPIYHKGSATVDEFEVDKKSLENRNMSIIYDRYGIKR